MAKRFTDTDKWKKKFIKSMNTPYKLFWLYILDDCDHSGIWIVDFEVAKLRLGEELEEATALELFYDKILPIDNGERWLILDFIDYQYGQLKEENRAHHAIIKNLRKYGLWHEEDQKIINPKDIDKPLTSPLQGAKELDKEREKDKEQEKDKGVEKIDFPFESIRFINAWGQWKDYKISQHKFKYKSIKTEQTALDELLKLSGGLEQRALEIIQQSIANGWKGLFDIKQNGKQQTTESGDQIGKQLNSLITNKYGNGAGTGKG